MNILIIFLLISFASMLAAGIIIRSHDSIAMPLFLIGFIGTMIMTPVSVLVPTKTSTKTSFTKFLVEKTPYRVVITVNNAELVYKDAKTVNEVDKIVEIVHIQNRNAWGFKLNEGQAAYILKFKE